MKHSILYKGETGCGKTYEAIMKSESFAIVVPCRQLAYEIFWDYPAKISRIDTGEVHIGDESGNRVYVYENLPEEPIDQQTLIIDEAQFLNDTQRGGELLQKVFNNYSAGKTIILLTATDTISDAVKKALCVKEIKLLPFTSVPLKLQLDEVRFANRVFEGLATLVFCRGIPTETDIARYAKKFGIDPENISTISSSTPSFERFQKQINFKNGTLKVLLATNVLAQGLNFPAQCVYIEFDPRDTWELIQQKIGRLSRPGYGMKDCYYCIDRYRMPRREVSHGFPDIVEEWALQYTRPSGEVVDVSGWEFRGHEIPSEYVGYRSVKYSRRFLYELEHRTGFLETAEKDAQDLLSDQSSKLEELLLKRA